MKDKQDLAMEKTIRKIIEIGIKESSFSILEVDMEPMVNICKEIYTLTGLKVNDYSLEKTPKDRIIHTWVFPMEKNLILNLRTLHNSIINAIESQFDDVDIEIKGIGLSIYVKATL